MNLEQRRIRREIIKGLVERGLSFRRVGQFFGISHTRVHQIAKKPVAKGHERSTFWAGQPEWRRRGRERIRYQVRARDNFTCTVCHKKWVEGTRHFDVHHLNGLCGKKSRGYDKSSEKDGLITVCHKCHYNHPEHTIQRKKRLYTSAPFQTA
jgi:predicted transcriptional regulator